MPDVVKHILVNCSNALCEDKIFERSYTLEPRNQRSPTIDHGASCAWSRCIVRLITMHRVLDHSASCAWSRCIVCLITIHRVLDHSASCNWPRCIVRLITVHRAFDHKWVAELSQHVRILRRCDDECSLLILVKANVVTSSLYYWGCNSDTCGVINKT